LPILWIGSHIQTAAHLRCVIFSDPKYKEHLGKLEEQLRCVQAITPKLMSAVIAKARVRFTAHGAAAKARVNRLIESSAWTDAALALVELELPQWTLRRIAFEDGEWHCSLSKQPWLSFGFDEVAEASHVILPVAILIALVGARRAVTANAPGVTTVPQVGALRSSAVCCDNFA
jgi:hypothetical protein